MWRWRKLGWCAGLVLVAGCSPADKAQVNQQVRGMRQEAQQAAGQAQRAAANVQLEARVKQALDSHKGLDARRIHIKAQDGLVTLEGNVTSRDQADLAERVAGQIKGVTSVQDQLTIPVPAKSLPPGPGNPAGPP